MAMLSMAEAPLSVAVPGSGRKERSESSSSAVSISHGDITKWELQNDPHRKDGI